MIAGKPLDVGSGVVAASFDADTASWLSIGAPHVGIGFVELSGMPPFDESRRGDSVATRAWRRDLARVEHAFLVVEVDGAMPKLEPDLSDQCAPTWVGDEVVVRAWAPAGASSVHQRWRVSASSHGRSLRIRLRGALDRPALAEITEVDPPSPTGSVTRIAAHGAIARLSAVPVNATATAELGISSGSIGWMASGERLVAEATCPPGEEVEIEIRVGVSADADPSPAGNERWTADRLTDRALAYVRGCTALRVGSGERVILTDHRFLPLSWTRDAYWQALSLLAADSPRDRGRVADHLRWLWLRCERPDGVWVRSHHANGRRKDRAFQADQQLYPFIELADYVRFTGAPPAGVRWDELVPHAWAATVRRVDQTTGLIASHETAADDPVEAPFLAAAQVLLWYTSERLAEVAEQHPIGLDVTDLRRMADDVRRAFARGHASADAPWAYAVGVDGRLIRYHDANDLPIAFAPLWGFCPPDDPGWRATIRFAFGPANPGWFAGRRSGLGSAHTPGPWPLGDVQAWVAAHTVGDLAAAAAALARLQEVAYDDGMLPEVYGADDEGRVRQWFAWPGAVLAAVRMLDADGRLEPMLRVSRR